MSQAKEFKDRKDVNEKYKWDLESILEGKNFEDLLKEGIQIVNEQIEDKDSKYNDKESFLISLKKDDEATKLFNKIENYIANKINQKISDPKFKSLEEDYSFKMFELNKKMGSEINRIFKHEEKLIEWMKLDEFSNYKKNILGILEQKKHKLSDEIEEYNNKTSRAQIDAVSTFQIITDSELNYKYAVSSTGEKTKITTANRIKLLKSLDEEVRKTTNKNFTQAYLQHKQSLSNLLYQHFKETVVMSKIRNFETPVDSLIFSDRADTKLLNILYDSVQEGKVSFKEYDKMRKQFFEKKYNKKFNKDYDGYLPLVKVKEEYTVEEGQKMILDAIKPMGEEYLSVVKRSFDERWIDYMTIKDKRSGAYSIGGSYGLDKIYILMNWDGELRSVATLAHELGHSLHSYFSDKCQPISKSNYPIFLAEIASIFNELMLTDYLLENSGDDKLKFKLLEEAIDGFRGTIMRQAEWSNYEYDLLNAIDRGEPISSFEKISQLYFENSKKYRVEDDLEYKEERTIGSIYVPHFYYGFYVYKYAIGYTVATVFFNRYKKEGKEALENYINKFLSAGGRDWPIQILKDAGIDLYDKNIYKEAFKQLDSFIERYLELGKKIFEI